MSGVERRPVVYSMSPDGPVSCGRRLSAGEWWRLADGLDGLMAGLAGSPLAHWVVSLGCLKADIEAEAGRLGELEIEAWCDRDGRAA